MLRIMGQGGAYHAGVEVYGTEWSFGVDGEEQGGTGIYGCFPRENAMHRYRESIEMGSTALSRREVADLLTRLAPEWPGEGYSLLRRNCCHFGDALCQNLGVGAAPAWVMSLADTGAALTQPQRPKRRHTEG